MDIHICGTCHMQYTSIEEFVKHKKAGCLLVTNGPVSLDGGLGNKNIYGASQTRTSVTQIQIAETERNGALITQTPPLNQASDIDKVTQETSSSKQELSKKDKKKQTNANSKSTTKKISGEKNERGPLHKCFKCNFTTCKFVTAHHKDLQRHRRTHTGEKPFVCQFCQKRFSRNDKRKIHERNHTGEKPYKCFACDYACADGGSLKKHVRIHTDERPYQCQLCSYASRNSSQLVVHLRAHTGDAPFHCQRCDAKFKTNSDLKRHLRIHTGEKPFTCEQCDYASHLKCNLKSHITSNHMGKKKYQCDECEYTCRTHKQLSEHTNSHHVPPKPINYKCMECPFTTASKLAFHRHERKHSDERPYKCRFCQYTSKYPGHVPLHMKKKHPEKGKVKGPVKRSGKVKIRFGINKNSATAKIDKSSKWPLKVPLPVIDGRKPYQCEDCEASFVREDSLRSHHRQHERLTEALESTAYAVLQLQNVPPTPTTEKQTQVRNVNMAGNTDTASEAVVAQSTASAIASKMIVVNVQRWQETAGVGPATATPSNAYTSTQTTVITTPTERSNVSMASNLVTHSQVQAHSLATAVQMQPGLSTINFETPAKASLIMSQCQSGQPLTSHVLSSNQPRTSASRPRDPAMQSVTNSSMSSFSTSGINFVQSQIGCSAITSSNIPRVSLQMGNSNTCTQADSSGRQMEHHSLSLPALATDHTSLLSTCGPEQSHPPSTFQEQSSAVQTQTLGYGTSNIPVLYTTLTPTPNAAVTSDNSLTPAPLFDQITARSPMIQSDPAQVDVTKANLNVVTATHANTAGQATVKVLYTDPSQGVGALLSRHSLQPAVISQLQSLQMQPAMSAPRIHVPAILPRPGDVGVVKLGREPKAGKLYTAATSVAQTQPQLRQINPSNNLSLQTASIVAATSSTTQVMPRPAVNTAQCGRILEGGSNLQLPVHGVRQFSSCQ